jgi:hypothetical protein
MQNKSKSSRPEAPFVLFSLLYLLRLGLLGKQVCDDCAHVIWGNELDGRFLTQVFFRNLLCPRACWSSENSNSTGAPAAYHVPPGGHGKLFSPRELATLRVHQFC